MVTGMPTEPPLEQIDYRILGPLEVLSGARLLPLGGLKQRAFLGVLVVHANRVVSRERLIDDLWGDDRRKPR
jgi:DNA-binding SARP family transcriptional activator